MRNSAHKRRELQFAEADIAARIAALQLDLERQRAELALYASDDEARQASSDERESELRRMRSVKLAGRRGARPRKAPSCPRISAKSRNERRSGAAT